MRLPLAFVAALGLAGLSVSAVPGMGVTEAHAQDAAYADKFKINIVRTGEKLEIMVEGLTVKDPATKADQIWYVNRDYPINLKLSGPATIGKAELVKEDATFEGTEKTGKAKKAKFTTSAKGAEKVKVAYKIVVCSDTSCSPPIRGEVVEGAAALTPPKK